jgi:hypothetical protein
LRPRSQVRTQNPIDLRDAVLFDFDGYLAERRAERPVEFYEARCARTSVERHHLRNARLGAAQAHHRPDALPVARRPAGRRTLELASMPELPQTSATGALRRPHQPEHAAVHLRSADAVTWARACRSHEPDTTTQIIASYGGREHAGLPGADAPQLKITRMVAQGASETPGSITPGDDLILPSTGTTGRMR